MLRVRHSPIHFELAEGVVLAGDAWGEPDAPPVVLLTGAGQTRHAWGQTGEALAAAGFRAIAVDHRGHGDSTWPTGARSEEHTSELQSLMRISYAGFCLKKK